MGVFYPLVLVLKVASGLRSSCCAALEPCAAVFRHPPPSPPRAFLELMLLKHETNIAWTIAFVKELFWFGFSFPSLPHVDSSHFPSHPWHALGFGIADDCSWSTPGWRRWVSDKASLSQPSPRFPQPPEPYPFRPPDPAGPGNRCAGRRPGAPAQAKEPRKRQRVNRWSEQLISRRREPEPCGT